MRAPVSDLLNGLPGVSAVFVPSDGFTRWQKEGYTVERLQEALAGLDMRVEKTIWWPKEYCVDDRVSASTKDVYCATPKGKTALRIRSAHAYSLTTKMLSKLPDDGFAARQIVVSRMKSRFMAVGGAERAIFRIAGAYPKLGSTVAAPVTRAEAQRALRNSGISLQGMPTHVLVPYPLLAREGEQGLTVNKHADNGFPVGGTWSTPGAADAILGLAVTMRKQLVTSAKTVDGVQRWKEGMERDFPHMVALRGKAKQDVYAEEKIQESRLRFYNVLPRQVMLNMQVATQPLESLSKNILDGSKTGMGLDLTKAGAEKLVAALEEQLASGSAYVHVGDDSWVIIKRGEFMTMFALDCSNFDLTQHADATLEVHRAVRSQLRLIDAAAADLWYAYARERLVVTAGTLVRRWKHAGPSGMPLQSKVNDMLMDVLINRALTTLGAGSVDEDRVASVLAQCGESLGFSVRVEQHRTLRARSVLGYLEQLPFLFVGFYFHVLEGRVGVFTDLPRTMAQMPYPGVKYEKTKSELLVTEAMRLGSMYLSAGVAPHSLQGVLDVWRAEVIELLRRAIRENGDVSSERLTWAVAENPFGPAVLPSLTGLLEAVQRDPHILWMTNDVPLSSSSMVASSEFWAPILGSGAHDWAAEAERELEENAGLYNYIGPPQGAPLPRGLPFVRGRPSTHPATLRNDGLVPPSAVWLPDKPKRVFRESGPSRRLGRVLESEAYEEFYDDDFAPEDGYEYGSEDEEFHSRVNRGYDTR